MATTSELLTRVVILIDDDLPPTDVISWLNDALLDLGRAVKATFPALSLENSTDSPVIPEHWHEALVLYAAARAKEQDSSINEADRFLVQYEARKADFVSYYEVPDEYKAAWNNDDTIANESFIQQLGNPWNWSW
jgi:hypothetical protein